MVYCIIAVDWIDCESVSCCMTLNCGKSNFEPAKPFFPKRKELYRDEYSIVDEHQSA